MKSFCPTISAILMTWSVTLTAYYTSNVKVFYKNKKLQSEVYLEAQTNVICICSSKDCTNEGNMTTIGFVAWQEFSELGFPISTSNNLEQIHSVFGYYTFQIDESSKRTDSQLCGADDTGSYQYLYAENIGCKGLSFTGRVLPKLTGVATETSPSATSVLTVHVDVTILKDETQFIFRCFPNYSISLNPLDIIIEINIKGWTFCNHPSVECPVSMDVVALTYLIWTLDIKSEDGAKPRLVDETNHYKKFKLGHHACIYLGKFYQTETSTQVNSNEDSAAGISNVTADGSRPVWLKQAPGFPTSDFSSQYSFFMRATEGFYDDNKYQIVYRRTQNDSEC